MPASYGVSTCVNDGLDRRELLEAVAAAGFRHVELGVDPELPGSWVHQVGSARRELDDAGVSPFSVHVPSTGWKCCHPDESVRRASLEAAAAVLAPAAGIGARVVVIHPTSPDAPLTAEEFEANRARARDSVAELAERAGRLGLLVAVENLPARGRPRPGALIGEVLEMVAGLGDHVGVCLDAGHSNANGARAADEVRVAGGKLLAVHIQDNNGEGEDQHLFPGRGTTDWEAFVAALDEIGFEKPRVFEVPSRKGRIAETLAGLAELARRWSEPR